MEERSRWSRGSGEWQTSQSQPIIGTPCEVPVPRKVRQSSELRVESREFKTCSGRDLSPLDPQLSTLNFFSMPAVLTLLRIKNLALVEDLEWQLGPGFTSITGETGAGKSII